MARVRILTGQYKGFIGYTSYCGEWVSFQAFGYTRDVKRSKVELEFI